MYKFRHRNWDILVLIMCHVFVVCVSWWWSSERLVSVRCSNEKVVLLLNTQFFGLMLLLYVRLHSSSSSTAVLVCHGKKQKISFSHTNFISLSGRIVWHLSPKWAALKSFLFVKVTTVNLDIFRFPCCNPFCNPRLTFKLISGMHISSRWL